MPSKPSLTLRVATPRDAEELLAIYAPYVTSTAISFEYSVPSVDEFRNRIQATLKTHPYLVLLSENHPIGYAYASLFAIRPAYRNAAETSIYLAPSTHGMGGGRMLYTAIEALLRRMNITNLYARIAIPEIEDEYLNDNSYRFHTHIGYRLVGRFQKCANKFDRWYDMVYMEKCLTEHPLPPRDPIPFSALDAEAVEAILREAE